MVVDIQSKADIDVFVDAFYARLFEDQILAPIFVDVAEINLADHLPLIKSYWAKLLLGDKTYSRHAMNIHRAVHAKQALTAHNFDRWLDFFCSTMDEYYCGELADTAKQIAATIAKNMATALKVEDSGN